MITATMMAAHLRRSFAHDPGAPHVFEWENEELTVGVSPIDRDERVVDVGEYAEAEVEITIIREDLDDPDVYPAPQDTGILDDEEMYVLRTSVDEVAVRLYLKANV